MLLTEVYSIWTAFLFDLEDPQTRSAILIFVPTF